MEKKLKEAIENYQCSGCIVGCDVGCYKKHIHSLACGAHLPGTIIPGIGKIFLGLPKGFNRLGPNDKTTIRIFESYNNDYNIWNVPAWKYLDKSSGNTLVRLFQPRLNTSYIDIFLEDCIDKIDCIEISKEEINYMD